MVTLAEFAIIVITISLSGVMSPGPLFAANVAYGLKGGIKTGLKMAYGHTVVELPLVVLLGVGAISLTAIPQFREITSILGALSLFVFAGIQIRSTIKKPSTVFEGRHGPFLAGIILSGLNPFFLNMVVYNRIQINHRRNTSLFICRNWHHVCVSYMDGLCMDLFCCVFVIKGQGYNF